MPGISSGLARAYVVLNIAAGGDTGPLLLEAKNFKTWGFAAFANGTIVGGALTIYGTLDPLTAGALGNPNMYPGYMQTPFVSAGNWFPLVAPSAQAETAGSFANPITAFDGSQTLGYGGPLVAVRATANNFTGGGTITLQAYAVN